ncbi:MAG TPA: type II toxin-antitoxin system VapC family toxin [Thermodesulfovibrionales bacterium]|nr:type II toxin-antitoxin system VapC family toxin [Thermodesulfovibrionales bacterium]
MKAILDTHVFLWWLTDDPRLLGQVRRIIADGENELFLSAASCWEISIKYQLKRLTLPDKPDVFISDQMAENAIRGLPILASHALHVFHLPRLHRDPFDRMIVSQSRLERLPVMTSDPLISQYKVPIIWK